MSKEKRNNYLLLPPKTCNKKTLVLDLDETLVHSQFMPFSKQSDVIIKIEIDNEIHNIHVMVRPGVKELLEKMEKLYEIVIFTASVSKYADPLLDIIDKHGYCPHRLFREHCSFMNTIFVKDLKRLGRDLKDIIIVDNSPLCYSLHPENGLPILTWFEDKSDRELYKIVPILEFLSNVRDVREFIPKLIGNDNQIDYVKAKQIINNSSSRFYSKENKEEKQNNNQFKNERKNKSKENNLQIINNYSNNNNNKPNLFREQKIVELAMKNIIANVNPNSTKNIINSIKNNNNIININQNQNAIKNNNIIASVNQNFGKKNNYNNYMIGNKDNSKNKIIFANKKTLKNEKEKNNMKLEIINSSSVKTVSKNNIPHSIKKNNNQALNDTNAQFKQKRKNYSLNGNYTKIGSINLNQETNSIIIKAEDNNNYNHLIKTSNNTPKINKSLNLFNNKNNHTTRSVKYTKKTNTCIVIPLTCNNAINNKMSKSLTKDILSAKNNNNSNKENIIHNKNNKNHKTNNNINNKIYKSIYSNTSSYNGMPKDKKQKPYHDLICLKYNRSMAQQKHLYQKQKNNTKIEKIEIIRNKNMFLNTGFIQNNKSINKINNINVNLSNNLTLSYKVNRKNLILNNIKGFNNSNTIRSPNQMKYNLTNSNILNKKSIVNYSPNIKYDKSHLGNNSLNNYLKMKNMHKNNSTVNDKSNTNNKSNTNISKKDNQKNINKNIYYSNSINKIKTTRPKSSSTVKFESRINNLKHHNNEHKKIKAKYQNKMQIEISDTMQKQGVSSKNNSYKRYINACIK
jgi:RNA polymerase II subunit A small phosphatase-like protein